VEIIVGEFEEFTRVIERRRWQKLMKPENHYNELIVREFYVNIYL